MKATKSDMGKMLELIKTHNLTQYNALIELTDKNIYDKILRNLCNICEMCRKYEWEFHDVLFSHSLINKMKSYISFGSVISLDKFKTVFNDAEAKHKHVSMTKVKGMRLAIENNPSLLDTNSLMFFKQKYVNSEIAFEKYTEYHKNKQYVMRKDYWKKKGYSDVHIDEKIKERQTTFSLNKCIEKYGKTAGRSRWEDRQRKWKASIGNKEYSELLLMQFKMGGKAFPQNAAYFIGIPIEKYSDDLFLKSIQNENEYLKIVFEKFTGEFSNYSNVVRKLTSQTYNKHKSVIDPKAIRNKSCHLDHKFSVFAGFVNQIAPEIIAHPCNLEMLSAHENYSKHAGCSITIEELNERISAFDT